MARPIKEGVDYFNIDVDIESNPKIEKLTFRYGNEGFAVYVKILCKVYANNGKFNISSDEDFMIYARKWNITPEGLAEIINYMRELTLFPPKSFLSKNIVKRLKRINSEREYSRNHKKNKADKENVFHVENNMKTVGKQKLSIHKEKESKENKSKENKSKEKEIKENNSSSFPPENSSSDKLLFNKCKDFFITYTCENINVNYLFDAKEAKNLKLLLGKLKNIARAVNMGYSSENNDDIEASFVNLITNIEDKWLLDRFTLCKINGSFNEISKNLNNATGKKYKTRKVFWENDLANKVYKTADV